MVLQRRSTERGEADGVSTEEDESAQQSFYQAWKLGNHPLTCYYQETFLNDAWILPVVKNSVVAGVATTLVDTINCNMLRCCVGVAGKKHRCGQKGSRWGERREGRVCPGTSLACTAPSGRTWWDAVPSPLRSWGKPPTRCPAYFTRWTPWNSRTRRRTSVIRWVSMPLAIFHAPYAWAHIFIFISVILVWLETNYIYICAKLSTDFSSSCYSSVSHSLELKTPWCAQQFI